MEPLEAATLPAGALVLVDNAPIIYVLEGHARLAARFAPLFERHARGEIALAVTTVTVAEVLTGPLAAGEEALARRYRVALESWQVIDFDSDIAELAARLRATYRLKLPDAIQLASALSIHADALVTHDRDFKRVRGMRILA
ncbi:MAG TPA: PIN domain-containing protein [Rhodanobacteraceae bacterium]|nr:PIN domain-containing protein [Rhodanobacteraceae bacterium]